MKTFQKNGRIFGNFRRSLLKQISSLRRMFSLYKVYRTEKINELYQRLDFSEQNWIQKMEKHLANNPQGKILKYPWFREKKYGDKRLYFIIDEKSRKILLLDFRSKKEQQKIINFTLQNMQEFLLYLKNL